MDVQEQLRQSIDSQQIRLRESVPVDREQAILALIHAIDQRSHSIDNDPRPDLVTGHRLTNLGGNMALMLCLSMPSAQSAISSSDGVDDWATQFLEACRQLAEAEQVLGHVETGFMRLVRDDTGEFYAWIATRRAPASWRERADFDWWASRLAPKHHSASQATERSDADYRRLAETYVSAMAYQMSYPPNADIDGCTIQTYRDVLSWLIGYELRERDRGRDVAPRSTRELIGAIATALRVNPVMIANAVAAFTFDDQNAAYHAALPGIAAAPLIKLDADRLVWSIHGLTSEPLLFLTRELRRRSAEAYHNSAYLREDVFRQDLYGLFPDKRFVTSTGRIELRRESGNVRTDVDAVIFDRKTGMLGFFELKSQDPFARSAAELTRQRDNLLYANRQVSGVLAWLQRYGADELLKRVDSRTAKTFRAQKVFPFVLGRYLAHFGDGAEPDPRAAWGTWPQVLRLLDGKPFGAKDANPIASLFNRLSKDTPLVRESFDGPAREIAVGDRLLTVHPSYAAYQAGARLK